LLIVCSNPKCRKEFKEPIILTILSVKPPKQYEACPNCFAKREPETPTEQEIVSNPQFEQNLVSEQSLEKKKTTILTKEKKITNNLYENAAPEKVEDSGSGFFKKVKALIPSKNGSKKEKQKNPKEPTTESYVNKEEEILETQIESTGNEYPTKEKTKHEKPEKIVNNSLDCPKTFGYLAKRSPEVPIPQGCLTCLKIVDCMLKIETD
jgi:hypothetical protein